MLYCYDVWSYSCFFFFFFKQKTAYEMRISDWSSDVCSSDLRDEPIQEARQLLTGMSKAQIRQRLGIESEDRPILMNCGYLIERKRIDQIGRASCRERVCQYV